MRLKLAFLISVSVASTSFTTQAQAPAAPAPAPGPTTTPAPTPDTKNGATPDAGAAPAVPGPTDSPALSDESEPDVTTVRTELSNVMDELIAARARVSVLSKALFNTPLSVHVVRRADEQRLSHLTLRLDGVPVHDSDGSALARGEADLYQGYATPGMHEVAIEVTEVAQANADYRYVRSERFRIALKKGMRTRVEFVLRDDSDMAEELPTDDEGEYDVRTRMRVEAEPVEGD